MKFFRQDSEGNKIKGKEKRRNAANRKRLEANRQYLTDQIDNKEMNMEELIFGQLEGMFDFTGI